jgi:hypothetical protein
LITETILPRYELLKQSVDQVEHVPGSRAEVVQQAMRHYYDARIDQFSFDVQLLSEEESAEKPDPDQTRLRRDTLNQKVESAMQELRGAANGLAQP